MDSNNMNNYNGQNQGQPIYQQATNPYGQPGFGQAPNTYGQPPIYGQPAPMVNPQNLEPVSIGTWLGIMFLSLIPCVNIVLLFVWAFADGKESRKNWAKAQLIFIAIMIVIEILVILFFGTAITALLYSIAGF